MYTPAPSAAEAAHFGLTVDEANEPTEVWPDNVVAVQVFSAMSTQWRSGFSGATGLDYGVLPRVMRWTSVPRSLHAEIFESIRVMEEAALKTMRKSRG